MILNTHFRSLANPKEDKEEENYTKDHNKRLKTENREIFLSGLNKTDYPLKDNLTTDFPIQNNRKQKIWWQTTTNLDF